MKRIGRRIGILLTLLVLAALGVAWARPDWQPERLQTVTHRIETWLAALFRDEDEEQEEGERRSVERGSTEMIDDGWCAAREKLGGTRSSTSTAGKSGPSDCTRLLPVIRLRSPELARRIGLETAAAVVEPHGHHLMCNAETAYDMRRAAEIIPRVAGVLKEVRADLGQEVHKGQVLAVVDSAEVGAAKANYLTAVAAVELQQATYDRTVKLTQAKAAPAKTELESLTALNQAKTSMRDAEQKLRNLNFDDTGIARIVRESDVRNTLEIVAPIDGTINAWDATRGEAVEPTTQIFGMADTTTMWLWIDVYDSDIVLVAPGQTVTFTISGTNAPVFTGKVTWMGTEVNPTTRTTRVRAELPNPQGRLRANQFGQATIQVEGEHAAIVVPRVAVQNDGTVDLVFLAQPDGSFRPQRVLARATEADDRIEIVWGLNPGQKVVTTRSFMLKAELFKDRLGAADND
jgi:cobalt-zinc-cadmium efflux system membrane fusion protein